MMIKIFKKGENIQLTKNIHLKETECPCSLCKETRVDLDHVKRLQKLREDLNSPITINSFYRCPDHNKAVGGEPNSQHMKGTASDIVVKGMTPDEVADACEYFNGLGRYDTFTHVDSRNSLKARWDYRKNKTAKTSKPAQPKTTISTQDQLPEGPSDQDIDDMLARVEADVISKK